MTQRRAAAVLRSSPLPPLASVLAAGLLGACATPVCPVPQNTVTPVATNTPTVAVIPPQDPPTQPEQPPVMGGAPVAVGYTPPDHTPPEHAPAHPHRPRRGH